MMPRPTFGGPWVMLVATLPAALLVAALAPLPSGAVVIGKSTVDGTSTELVALLPEGGERLLGVERHAAGMVPRGQAYDGHLALALQPDGADAATVIVRDLDTGARAVLGDGAVASQAPVLALDGVRWVRARENVDGADLTIVHGRVGSELGSNAELARAHATWLTPVRGVLDRWLLIEPAGDARIVTVASSTRGGPGALRTVARLGKGRVRSPALVSGRWIVERAVQHAGSERSQLVDVDSGAVLRAGLPGMDPLTVAGPKGSVAIAGTGEKRGGVVVFALDDAGKPVDVRTLSLERAGVATPKAALADDEGHVRVVVWLDRGRALPGELWLVADGAVPRRLLTLAAGDAVEVYGFADARPVLDAKAAP